MNPTGSDRHVSTPLTAISIAYAQDAADFVARRVFPVVQSKKQYDRFYVFDRADLQRVMMAKRAPSTESQGVDFRLSNSPFSCDVFSLHKDIDEQDRSNADEVFNLDAEATEFLTQQALLREEYDFSQRYLVTGVWGNELAGVASGATPGTSFLQWNDGSSTPIEDIRGAKTTIKRETGIKANKLVITEPVWNQLVDHPSIIDRVKYGAGPSTPAIVQRQALAQLLELDEIMVMGGVINSAAEGQAISSDFIGGKSALLVHTPSKPGRMIPAAGYTFAWQGYLGGTLPTRIKRYYMAQINSDRVEIDSAYVQQITGADLGFLFRTAVA